MYHFWSHTTKLSSKKKNKEIESATITVIVFNTPKDFPICKTCSSILGLCFLMFYAQPYRAQTLGKVERKIITLLKDRWQWVSDNNVDKLSMAACRSLVIKYRILKINKLARESTAA